MKKKVLFMLLIYLITVTAAFAQDMIPNHSFEQWDGDPVGWFNPLGNTLVENVLPSDDAQDGQVSVMFKIVLDNQSGQYLPAGLNSDLFPVSEKHTSLDGFYKGTSSENDFISILVYMYSEGGIIGSGTFMTMESQSNWTPFSATINYFAAGTPDTAIINIGVGGETGFGHEGTEFKLDNLQWDHLFGINDTQVPDRLTLSPNPAGNNALVQFNLNTPDRITFELITPTGNVVTSLDNRDCKAGNNSLRFDTSGLPDGLYILRAQGERYGFVKKLVVNR